MENEDLQFIPWKIDPALQPYVKRMVGFRDAGPPVIRREMLMVGCPMLFVFGSPFRLSERANPAEVSSTLHGSFTAGMFDTFTMSQSTGPTSGLHVDLTPPGAYLLTGIPMCEFSNQIVSMPDLWGPGMNDLQEQLANLPSWNNRFRHVERFLFARMSDRAQIDRGVSWAWNQLVAARGNLLVQNLADELQWSRKRLRDAFLREIGFPAKTVARMLRYRYAVDVAQRQPGVGWSEIAQLSGYSDQAHLHRDVLMFAGTTPGELRRGFAEATFVQDDASR